MANLTFLNAAGSTIQLTYSANGNGASSVTLPVNQSDSRLQIKSGDNIYFWWRSDGNACTQCNDPNPPCSMNTYAVVTEQDGSVNDAQISVSGQTYPEQTN